MNIFKRKINKGKINIFLLFFVLIFPFIKPQIFDNYTITTYIYYILKIISCFLIIFLFFYKFKLNQIHPFVFFVLIYRLIMLIPTLVNKNADLIRFLGISFFDISFAMLIQYGLIVNKRIFLKTLIFILDFWIIINTLCLFIPGLHIVEIDYWNNKSYTSILGVDNRFIYYYIVELFARLVYKYTYSNSKTYPTLIMYTICLLTLIYTYSTAALLVWLLTLVLFIILKMKLRIVFLNYKFILICFLIINFLLVFFRVQNYFEDFIVNILHKDTTLSNRTFIWDKCIMALKGHYLFGYGYENIEAVMQNMNGANHAHNYMLMIIYRSGIIGFIAYCTLLILPNKVLKNMKYTPLYNIYVFFIIMSLILCLFDSFDYTLFYFVMFCPCFFQTQYNFAKVEQINIALHTNCKITS